MPLLLYTWENLLTDIGQEFPNISEFHDVCKYAMEHHFEYVFIKNENYQDMKEITFICGANINVHKRASKQLIANLVKSKLDDTPRYKPREMIKDIARDYGIERPYLKAWRGKEIAITEFRGTEEDAYNRLPAYLNHLLKTNPGSHVAMQKRSDNKFRRVFISLIASTYGFKNGNRPIIFLDGTHLKARCHGTLLAAISIDSEDQMFPLAYSIVDAKDYDNLFWFLENLNSGIGMDRPIIFISDRQIGLGDNGSNMF
ncbi:uncharacterized protein LOC105421036 [Amborella trichopoda]|uniref:uncharacterized protein LOC105421036 n=1 Tax=Amborella trichopoda TaxID=13333 RepID=UPI0005D3BC01|nr:uncharacterized protein LOC105421036 [Amborella trichopoda]|eukprot:XP_011625200.1 uncharacterized protein LOC105421036 [Amborella trichopoda]